MPVDVPFLIGLDFLDLYKLYADTVYNKLCGPYLNIYVPLRRKQGHIYLKRTNSEQILFTKTELIKLHRIFSHPFIYKLMNLLKFETPWKTDEQTK